MSKLQFNQSFIGDYIGYFQFLTNISKVAMSVLYVSLCAHIGALHLYK